MGKVSVAVTVLSDVHGDVCMPHCCNAVRLSWLMVRPMDARADGVFKICPAQHPNC